MQNSIAKKVFAVGSALATAAVGFAPLTASAAAHSVGTNVLSSDGTIWLITQNNCRRAYTSGGAFLSYGFNSFSGVMSANADDLALPVCPEGFIAPQDGKLITSDRGADKGTTYFISMGKKRGFTSAAVFSALGYKFTRGTAGDVSFLMAGANIDNSSSVHPAGSLVNDNGTIKLVGDAGYLGIPTVATFTSWGYSFADVVPANSADKALAAVGVMASRDASTGALSPSWTTNPSNPSNPGTATAPTNISVSLSSDTPASGTIVSGQSLADLAHFTFSGNGSVSNVTLMRTGVSSDNTLNNVYLFDGNTRISDNASVSNGLITFNNPSGLFTVSGSKNISVRADVASTATSGQTLGVSVQSFTVPGNTTPATVSNVAGNQMGIASMPTQMTQVTIGANTVSSANVNAGTMGYTAWSSPVTVSGRAGWLKGATFKYIGSAANDALQNVKLYLDGTPVGNAATVNAMGFLSFDFTGSPVNLTTGAHTVDVRVDIIKGANRNFLFQLQNSGDFFVTDSQLMIGAPVWTVTQGTAFSTNTGGTITINNGTVTVTQDPAFSSLTNVTGGATSAKIASFKVQSYGEDVKVNQLTVLPVLSSGASLNNVSIFYNGAQVGSSMNWSGTSTQLVFNLGSSLVITAGTATTLDVRADIVNSSNVNYTSGTISAQLIAGSSNAQGQTSSQITSVPASTVSGNSLTIQTGALSLAKNPGYASQTLSPNTAGTKIGSFVVQNTSTSETVRVTNLNVSLAFAGGQAYTNFSNLKTSETSGSGATPIAPSAGSPSINNFSVNFNLAPGETRTIDIISDISSTSGGTVIPTLTLTAIGNSSNVNVSPTATAGQTITVGAASLTNSASIPGLVTSSSMVSQFVVGGASNVPLAQYNFLATNGAVTLTELKFTVSGSGSSPITSVKVGNVSAPVIAGVAYLTGLSISVPNSGSGAYVNVLPTFNTVGSTGEASAVTAILTLSYVKYNTGNTTSTICASGCGATFSSTMLAANTVTLVGTRPTVTVPTATASGLSISGTTKIAEVTVTADAAGSLKLNDIQFVVSSSGFSTAPTAVATPVISISNSSSTPVSGAACTPTSLTVLCEFGTTSNTDYDGFVVQAGQSVTFSLFGSLTGAAATGSGIPTVTTTVTSSAFNWDDMANSGVTGTNLGGSLIYGFPSNSYSIKQ